MHARLLTDSIPRPHLSRMTHGSAPAFARLGVARRSLVRSARALAAGTCLSLLGALALPAAAQDDMSLSEPGDTEEVCRPLPSGPSIPTCDGGYEGGVALVGGSVASEGSILICHDNEYRPVCDDFFTHRGSGVVCRQLGYPTGVPTLRSHFVGDADDDDVSYWLDDVACEGTEANLGECYHPGWGLDNCRAGERAGVICTTRVTGIYAVGGEGQVSLAWDRPLSRSDHGFTGHEYRYKTRGEDGYGPWQPIPDSASRGANVASYTVTGLTKPGTVYSFQVRIVGGGHASEPATASVRTAGEANRLPEFGGPATRAVAENSAAGSAVGAPVTATDADGDPLRYSLEADGDHASFTIDPASGQLRTRAAHDYEARSRYAVTVTAADGAAGSATVAVTIEIADVEEQPTAVEIVTGPGADGVWNAGERVEVRVRFGVPVRVDVPPGGREPEVVLAFSGSAGASSRAHSFGRAAYTGGSGSDTLTFAYTVTADNAGAGSVAVPRDALVKRDAHIEPASGEPERDRTENSGGTETTENPGATAATHTTGRPGATGDTDSHGDTAPNAVSASKVQAAQVKNTTPLFTEGDPATRSVAENTAAGENIGPPVAATDPDTGDTLTYSLRPQDTAFFAIVSASGQLKTQAGVTYDHETTPSYQVTVTVRDSSNATDTITVTITVTDVNERPVFEELAGKAYIHREFPEDTGPNMPIGAPITAVDPDGDPVTYSLSTPATNQPREEDHTSFNFDTESGQIRTKEGVTYDYDGGSKGRQRYTLDVTATDEWGATTVVLLLIDVLDVNEPPTFPDTVPTNLSVAEDARKGKRIGTLAADDPELKGLHYRLAGRDGNSDHTPFKITVDRNEGLLRIRTDGVLNYEQPADANGDGVYEVTVSASDEELLTSEPLHVTVEVMDAPGKLCLSSCWPLPTLQVGQEVHAILEDPDGIEADEPVRWVWERASAKAAPDEDWTRLNNHTASYTPDAGDGDHYLRVTATYTDGDGTADKKAQVISAESVTLPDSLRPPPSPSGPPGRPSGGSSSGGGPPAEERPAPVGYLENPGDDSFQSGIGVISGWVCEADKVEIEIETERGETERYEAGYGTARLDTAMQRKDGTPLCGDTDNGFGLLFNWNLLGDGEHTVVASVDEEELGRATVTVTTVGTGDEEEFLRDVAGACVVADFPMVGQTTTLEWQETKQNFVITRGPRPAGESRAGVAGVGYLENPGPNSFQSGIGVISGWVCEAEAVEIVFETAQGGVLRFEAAYGTERADTAQRKDGTVICGDTDNGFGLLFNWNLLGDGEHTVVALVDEEELGRAVVRVTTVGTGAEEEFLRGAEGECVVEDFPMVGETVTLEWQESSQNFVITDVQ